MGNIGLQRRYFILYSHDDVKDKELYFSKGIKNPMFKGADCKSAPAAHRGLNIT